VLLRAMTNTETYVGAFEAHGIPVYVVQGTAFYQKSEVSDLIAFLELVLHPDDELLRTTVLTSSLFGVTFTALVEHRLKARGSGTNGSSNGKSNGAAAEHRGLQPILRHWVERRDSATAAEILQDVIRKTDFDVVMMAQRNGPQRVANVGKLIEITRGLARQGTTALDDVVRYLRERALDTSVRESEAQIVSQADDVVRVLSVHQAKGLEFDIVVIPDLAARSGGRSGGDRVFFSDRWGLLAGASYGLHRKPLPHALILEEKLLDEDQQYEEEKRLLYVAVTRARKMLVLGEGFSKQTGPWLQWIERIFENAEQGAIAKAREGQTRTVRFKGFSVKVLPASQLNVPEQLSFRTMAEDAILVGEPDTSRMPAPPIRFAAEMTPSDLSSLHGCFRFFHWTRMLGLSEPGARTAGDGTRMRLGSEAHRFLETGAVPSAAALQAAGLSDLDAVFTSSQWRELSAGEAERELPFIMHLDVEGRECWIRGRIDAAVPGEIPRVVDYKYAVWREGAEANYEVQMAAYALALMKATGAARAAAELWYLKAPLRIVRREYALKETEARLRSLLSKYFQAIENDEWPAADRGYCDRTECGFRDVCWGALNTAGIAARDSVRPVVD
jgi:UvrD-like helicase family protein/PD-(D/E)XK nuclease superfamily protein